MSDVIIKRLRDRRFFSGFDEGCTCWTLHEKDAKALDECNDSFTIDVLYTQHGVELIEQGET